MSVIAWTKDGQEHVLTGVSISEIMDKADGIGAVRVKDGNGTIARKLFGDWYWL